MKRFYSLFVLGLTICACGDEEPTGPGERQLPRTVVSVVVTPASVTVSSLGEVVELIAAALDANGNAIPDKPFTWSTSNGDVASVDSTGQITALANGTATIGATTDGVSGTALVTVAQVVAAVVLTPVSDTLVFLGEKVQMTAIAIDAGGNTLLGKPIGWTSDDKDVATVTSSGLVTAVSNGTVTIAASADGINETAVLLVDQVAAQLEFATEPTGRKAGLPIDPAVRVVLQDAGGNTVSDGTGPISLTLATNPSAGTLAGTNTVNATAGIAEFSDLSIDRVGTGYTMTATSGSLPSVTSAPFRIGACPCAYVTTDRSTVKVIELASRQVIGSVAVGTSPGGVAITPDGSFAYVTNTSSNNVSVIEIAADTVVATVDLGYGPVGIAITPNGEFAYVANRFGTYSGPVSVIATTTNEVATAVNVGPNPIDVAITPDGAYAYVTNSLSGTVSVIETASDTVVATIGSFYGGPRGVAITPNGNHAYVATNEPCRAYVVETASNTVVDTVSVTGSPVFGDVAITPDGAFVYVTAYDQLKVIATASNTVATTIDVEKYPSAIAITPTGDFVYLNNWNAGTVSVIETASKEIVATINVGGSPTALAITP